VENRLRDVLKHDRARVQMGKLSRFGLLELSRQRLQPSLGETSHVPCPRCHGIGFIRGIESSALHILRIIQEEAMKENTGAVHAQVPVDVATFLLNEKRAEIYAIEARLDVAVVLIPNLHLETPHYQIVRVRHDDLAEIGDAPSYRRVEMPEQEDVLPFGQDKAKPERQEAAVKGITPAQPAPTVAEPVAAPVAAAPVAAEDGGLIGKIVGWFKSLLGDAPAAAVEPKVETKKPAAREQQRGPRQRNERRGNGNGQPRRERDEQRGGRDGNREERQPRQQDERRRGGQPQETAARDEQQPRQERAPRREREPREAREPREPRDNAVRNEQVEGDAQPQREGREPRNERRRERSRDANKEAQVAAASAEAVQEAVAEVASEQLAEQVTAGEQPQTGEAGEQQREPRERRRRRSRRDRRDDAVIAEAGEAGADAAEMPAQAAANSEPVAVEAAASEVATPVAEAVVAEPVAIEMAQSAEAALPAVEAAPAEEQAVVVLEPQVVAAEAVVELAEIVPQDAPLAEVVETAEAIEQAVAIEAEAAPAGQPLAEVVADVVVAAVAESQAVVAEAAAPADLGGLVMVTTRATSELPQAVEVAEEPKGKRRREVVREVAEVAPVELVQVQTRNDG